MALTGEDSSDVFKKLFRFDLHPIEVEEIELEDFQLKLLTQIPCSVAMHRFNVLHSLEEKLKKQQKASGKSMSAEKKQKFLLKHAYPSYKKFYQPRALWFQEQRKAAQELRQNRRHINLLTIKMEQHSEYSIDEWISTFNNTEDLYEPNSDDIYIPNSDDEEKKVETDDVNYVDFKMLSQGTTSTQTPLMPSQEIEKTMMTTRLKKKTLNKRPRT